MKKLSMAQISTTKAQSRIGTRLSEVNSKAGLCSRELFKASEYLDKLLGLQGMSPETDEDQAQIYRHHDMFCEKARKQIDNIRQNLADVHDQLDVVVNKFNSYHNDGYYPEIHDNDDWTSLPEWQSEVYTDVLTVP